MASLSFDYARPYDIMVGYWVGTANIYSPNGVYVMSTKSYVSVYWKTPYTILSFRESAEDDLEYQGPKAGYFDSRRADKNTREKVLRRDTCRPAGNALRVLAYDFDVRGPYCETVKGKNQIISVIGRQTRPDTYQFHVRKRKADGQYHHIYNSHHLPSPDDWHIIGPVVGRVGKEEGMVGMAVVQNFRRLSYDVPVASVCQVA